MVGRSLIRNVFGKRSSQEAIFSEGVGVGGVGGLRYAKADKTDSLGLISTESRPERDRQKEPEEELEGACKSEFARRY